MSCWKTHVLILLMCVTQNNTYRERQEISKAKKLEKWLEDLLSTEIQHRNSSVFR